MIATGTDRDTAAAIFADFTRVTSAASGTGVVLPFGVPGMSLVIFQDGANPIKVYGSIADTIDGVAGVTGVTLSAAKRAQFVCFAADTWLSAQLGVPSA